MVRQTKTERQADLAERNDDKNLWIDQHYLIYTHLNESRTI
jgi:hypothetical protein